MNTENKLIGANGGLLIDDTSAHTGNFYMIVVREDTVIATLTEKGGANGLTAWAIASTTLIKGDIITPNAEDFTAITLTSGSIIAYNS